MPCSTAVMQRGVSITPLTYKCFAVLHQSGQLEIQTTGHRSLTLSQILILCTENHDKPYSQQENKVHVVMTDSCLIQLHMEISINT